MGPPGKLGSDPRRDTESTPTSGTSALCGRHEAFSQVLCHLVLAAALLHGRHLSSFIAEGTKTPQIAQSHTARKR